MTVWVRVKVGGRVKVRARARVGLRPRLRQVRATVKARVEV